MAASLSQRRCSRLIGLCRFLAAPVLFLAVREDVFFAAGFFLAIFLGGVGFVRFLCGAFFAVGFDLVCLRLLFFLLEGMAAVYHRN